MKYVVRFELLNKFVTNGEPRCSNGWQLFVKLIVFFHLSVDKIEMTFAYLSRPAARRAASPLWQVFPNTCKFLDRISADLYNICIKQISNNFYKSCPFAGKRKTINAFWKRLYYNRMCQTSQFVTTANTHTNYRCDWSAKICRFLW